MRVAKSRAAALAAALSAIALTGCATGGGSGQVLPPANFAENGADAPRDNYIIGAMDEITVFVWRNQELGVRTQVRPDGRITTP